MPAQPTNLTSGTARDGAVPGLDLSIALVNEAIGDTVATARPAAATRGVVDWLGRCWRAFQERRHREGLRVTLQELSDRQLMDIGVTRAEIDYIAAHRAIDRLRDSTTNLWIMSRGVM
jgi:uncharacterized protein YjiS (DUF1127 family)